jgi:glycosyltransferase involved in cell wall biosynthesis
MTVRLLQITAGFADGDAISREAREIRRAARELGLEAEIHAPADCTSPGAAGDCLPLDAFSSGKGDVVIYHYAIASPASELFRAAAGRRIVRYHNITPARFFDGYDDEVARKLRAARKALPRTLEGCEAVWADSDYNGREILELGVDPVVTVPLFFRAAHAADTADPAMLARYSGRLRNVLFVGRMAPNKCVEDLIQAFAWLNRVIDPATRLILVGSDRSCPRYFAMLRMLAARLGLANICFEGFVSEDQLTACYRAADAFVCTSRHEGYCLPLLEAMTQGVPVIARSVGGMPEAMGKGGVLFDDMDPPVLAELIGRVLVEDSLRGEILASQAARLAEAGKRDLAGELRELLDL